MNIKNANKSPLAKSKSVTQLPQPAVAITTTGMGKKLPVAATTSKKGATLRVASLIEDKGVTSSSVQNTDQELKKRGEYSRSNI